MASDDQNKYSRSAEKKRVEDLLRRDRGDKLDDQLRRSAEIEVADGKFVNLQDTVIPPTREQLSHGEYRTFTPRGRDGTIRNVKAFRRLEHRTVARMHGKGQLSDEGLAACRWYANLYEKAGLEGNIGSVDYGKEVFSSPMDRVAFTERQQEAQCDFRLARGFLPLAFVKFFDAVTIHDIPVHRAVSHCRINRNNANRKFKELTEKLAMAHSELKKS